MKIHGLSLAQRRKGAKKRNKFLPLCVLGVFARNLLCLFFAFQISLFAEPSGEEKSLFTYGKKAMEDHLYEFAETKFQALLDGFPNSDYREEAGCLLAQVVLSQGRWQEAREILESRLPSTSAAWQDRYYFWLGQALLKGESFEEAYGAFEKLNALYPQSPLAEEARFNKVQSLFGQGKHDQAQEQLKVLQKEGSREMQVRATLAMAVSFRLQKKYDQALEILNRLGKEERDNKTVSFQVLSELAELDWERKKLDSARDRFEALTRMDRPEARNVAPNAFYKLGQIEVSSTNWMAAARNYEQAFTHSDDASFRLKCVDDLIPVYLKLNKPDSLADKLRNWASENSKTGLGEALLLDTGALWQNAGNHDQAIQAFQNFFEKYPNGVLNDQAHFKLGWVFLEDKKYESALSEFQKAAERGRTPQLQAAAWFKMGDLQNERQQYEAAVAAYLKCSQVKGASSDQVEQALYQAANADFKAGKNAEVVRLHELHETQFPTGKYSPEFLLLMAETQRKSGDMEKVAEDYKTLLDRYPASSSAPMAMLGYAEALYNLGKFKEASDGAEALVGSFPKDERAPIALNIQAKCLERLGQTDKAIMEFESIFKQYPDTLVGNESKFWLGTWYLRQKNFAKAQEEFELLLKNSPNGPLAPEAAYHAAFAAWRFGQKKEDAPRLIKLLVQNYPKSPWVFDGQFLYADILTENGDFQGALRIFDDLVRDYSPPNNPSFPERVPDVQGRRGQCLRQLKRYEEALAAFKSALDSPQADATSRNEAFVEMGKTYENMKDSKKALEYYLKPLYERPLQQQGPDEREFIWVCKGGFEAERILEDQKDWKAASQILKRLIEANLPCKKEAGDRLKKLQAEHADAN